MSNIADTKLTVLTSIHPYSLESIKNALSVMIGGVTNCSSIAWGAGMVDNALFIPFLLEKQITVNFLWWFNGAAVAQNVDCGIYDVDGNRLVSTGVTLSTGANDIQSVAVTPTKLGPGIFYIAITSNNAAQTFFGVAPGNQLTAYLGMAFMGTADPLPLKATLATIAGKTSLIPMCGLSSRSI